MGGGDLLNLLIERDVFEEDFTRFYVAEVRLTTWLPDNLARLHLPSFAPFDSHRPILRRCAHFRRPVDGARHRILPQAWFHSQGH